MPPKMQVFESAGSNSNFQTPVKSDRPLFGQGSDQNVEVIIDLVSAVHGKYEDGEDGPATLLVIDIKLPRLMHDDRPLTSAFLTVVFSAVDEHDEDPVVDNIAPSGEHVFSGSSAPTIGAGYTKSPNGDEVDEKQATLEGEIRDDNVARWVFRRSGDGRQDLPAGLRGAILVKAPEGEFRAVVKFDGESNPDRKSTPDEKFFGQLQYSFEGESERQSKGPDLQHVDVDNMSHCLDALCAAQDW